MFKRRITTVLSVVTALLFVSPVYAGIIDFEDLPLGTTVNVGGIITSCGVPIHMQDYIWSNGTVFSSGHADIITPWGGFTSSRVLYPNNINALFDFAGSVGQQSQVVIPYYNSGGNVNFHVNPAMGGAIVRAYDITDPAINGAFINGVSISVTGSSDYGVITLTGPIDQVLIGGQETLLDDIQYVPEPASVLICSMGAVWLAGRRRR